MLYKDNLAFIADYFRYRSNDERTIVIISVASLLAAVITLIKAPSPFIPGWYLAILYLPILIGISYFIGKALRVLLPFKAEVLTYTLVVTTTLSLWFCYSQYYPIHEIIIPTRFKGQIRLFLSNENHDYFKINNHGVGYISQKTYKKGFKPKIIQEGVDITDRMPHGSHVIASYQSTIKRTVSYAFVQLSASGEITPAAGINVEELIRVGALDTTRARQEVASWL